MLKFNAGQNGSISIYNESNSEETVICVYVSNGVMHESAEKLGISNFVDELLFNYIIDLSESLNAKIEFRTYYFYSELIISCKRTNCHSIFSEVMCLVLSLTVNSDLFNDIRNHLMRKIEQNEYTIDDLFNEKYYHSTRLSDRIIGNIQTVESISPNELIMEFIYL